jgi:hypothetical protein
MYSLELARANADELLREARKARGHAAVPTADRFRFRALRRLTR